MKTVYIADDGKQFEDELECQHYEWVMNHKNFATIEFFDKDGLSVMNVLSEESYEKTERVNIYNTESVEELQEFADYTGFGSYYEIKEPGIWTFSDEGFVKVANVQEKKPIGTEYVGQTVLIGYDFRDRWYQCSLCHCEFGSWAISHQKVNKYGLHYCPNCKQPLSGLER